jgi:hypothetical protein
MSQEPTLADLMKDVWRARFYILACVAALFVLSFIFIVSSTSQYRATMIVAPADGYALGDYASSISEGERVVLPFWRPKDQEGVSTDFYRFVYTMKGSAVAAILLKDDSVLAGIAKDGRWNSKRQSWSAEELSEYIDKNIRIEHLGTTPLRRISYQHPDSQFAAVFLRKLHLVSDQLIRRDRRRQSESRITYLEDTLRKAVNPDHRKVITNLLMQQEHIRMLANLDEAYAAIVVEAPSSTPRPVWPNKSLIFALSGILGIMGGYLIWSFRNAR